MIWRIILGKSYTKKFLVGNLNGPIDLIAKVKIKGIAGVVGCSNLTSKGYNVFIVEITKELLKVEDLQWTFNKLKIWNNINGNILNNVYGLKYYHLKI